MDLGEQKGFIRKVNVSLGDEIEAKTFFLGLKPNMPLFGRGYNLTRILLDPEADFPIEFTVTESTLRKVGRTLIAKEIETGNRGLMKDTVGLKLGTEISQYLRPELE